MIQRSHLAAIVCLAVAACKPSPGPGAPPPTAIVTAPPPSPTASYFAVPATFSALGTEPFWSAKIVGGTLTYTTPEDPVGRPIAVTREAHAEFVEFRATLGGKPLALRVSKGPCSDGMSDIVYPLSVVRTLGEDEQRGCARTGQTPTEAGDRTP